MSVFCYCAILLKSADFWKTCQNFKGCCFQYPKWNVNFILRLQFLGQIFLFLCFVTHLQIRRHIEISTKYLHEKKINLLNFWQLCLIKYISSITNILAYLWCIFYSFYLISPSRLIFFSRYIFFHTSMAEKPHIQKFVTTQPTTTHEAPQFGFLRPLCISKMWKGLILIIFWNLFQRQKLAVNYLVTF